MEMPHPVPPKVKNKLYNTWPLGSDDREREGGRDRERAGDGPHPINNSE